MRVPMTDHPIYRHSAMNIAIARERFDDAERTHEQTHERFFLARLLGLEFEYTDDTCTVTFRAERFLCNPKGSLHGGIICLAMDTAMGHLLYHLGVPAVTLELKTQFILPLRGGSVRAVARTIKRGRSVCYLQCEMFDEQDRSVAFATSTWKAV